MPLVSGLLHSTENEVHVFSHAGVVPKNSQSGGKRRSSMNMDIEPLISTEVTTGTASEPDAPFFYVHKEGVNYGPDSEENLRGLCAQGWLLPDDMVWREGEPEWQPAGIVFPTSFPDKLTAIEQADLSTQPSLDLSEFFEPCASRPSEEKSGLWRSAGIALLIHAVIFGLVVGWLQIHPLKFSEYPTTASEEPPLEVAMVTESQPVAPPPPPTPEPPPPDPTPPPPPPPPDIPPPPPAPPEMPIPVVPPPVLSTPEPPAPPNPEPVIPQPVAPPAPKPEHHHTAHPVVRPSPPVAPPVNAPEVAEAGPPEYLADPQPEYPFAARQHHQAGTVLLLVTMDEAGNPTRVSIEQSSGYSILDQAALKKVAASWRFKPGSNLTVHVPVEFHLE